MKYLKVTLGLWCGAVPTRDQLPVYRLYVVFGGPAVDIVTLFRDYIPTKVRSVPVRKGVVLPGLGWLLMPSPLLARHVVLGS